MKIGIEDVKTIELLELYGIDCFLDIGEGDAFLGLKKKAALPETTVYSNSTILFDSYTDCVISALNKCIPPAGTPNAELTDEEKGLIQLLFEVEKALEEKEAPKRLAKVFLGGTCNNSTWRNQLMPLLSVDYFNPVVKDWNEEAQKEEEKQKKDCAIHLYVITSETKGVFSIAEAVASANEEGVQSLLFVIPDGFDKAAIRSLNATAKLVGNQPNGFGYVLNEANTETYWKVIAARLNDFEVEKALA